MRVLSATLASFLLLLATSCHPERIIVERATGMRLSPSGQPEFVYAVCRGEVLRTVWFQLRPGGPTSLSNYELLWQIDVTRRTPADHPYILSIEIGVVPEGFEEVLAMRQALSSNAFYSVNLRTNLTMAGTGFRPEQLRPGLILSEGESITMQAFQERAKEKCAINTAVPSG